MATKDVVLNENDEDMKPTGLPSEEVVAMSQEDLIKGLLEAAEFETNEDTMKKIRIERAGKVLFEFMIHPLSEKEMMRLKRLSTPYYKNPAGPKLPKIEGDMKLDEFRSRKIYAATTDEYKEKLWDNPRIKAALNEKGKSIIEAHEIIDTVLMAGEKAFVSNAIDDISGFNNDEELELEDYAKN